MGNTGGRLSTTAASTALTAVGGLHLLWATGSTWPVRDPDEFAEVVAGQPRGEAPPPAACVAVGVLLGAAATVVSGRPRRLPRAGRAAATGVVTVLATRGVLGLAGRTDLVSPGSTSERFRALDRRYYAPLCLAIAAAALPSTRPSTTRP